MASLARLHTVLQTVLKDLARHANAHPPPPGSDRVRDHRMRHLLPHARHRLLCPFADRTVIQAKRCPSAARGSNAASHVAEDVVGQTIVCIFYLRETTPGQVACWSSRKCMAQHVRPGRTALAGWGARIRTWEWRIKIGCWRGNRGHGRAPLAHRPHTGASRRPVKREPSQAVINWTASSRGVRTEVGLVAPVKNAFLFG
jgi:hypothetical protein